jgi:hypothetical protein
MDSRSGRDTRRAVRLFGLGLIVVLAAGTLVAAGPGGGLGGYGYGYGYGGGHCGYGGCPTPTPTATPTTAPTTAPTPPPPPPDTTAPSVNSRILRGQTVRSILKRGLGINVTCNENCKHVAQLFVNKKQARKLGIKRKAKKRVLVGKKTTLLTANVAKNIRVKLSPKAKRGLRRMKRRHVRKLQLTIGTSATDAANNVRRSTTTKSFKR